MHSKALRKAGVAQDKLDALAGWRVSAHQRRGTRPRMGGIGY